MRGGCAIGCAMAMSCLGPLAVNVNVKAPVRSRDVVDRACDPAPSSPIYSSSSFPAKLPPRMLRPFTSANTLFAVHNPETTEKVSQAPGEPFP